MNVEHRTSNYEHRTAKSGFSLMEVLIAVGTLALGMLFIASVFPAGIHWTTVASERTIAAIAADDAFATIKLYGISLNDPNWIIGGQTPIEAVSSIYSGEYGYPSYGAGSGQKKYWWSAICRKIDTNDVQITVFVSRKVGSLKFYALNQLSPPTFKNTNDYPVAIPVEVTGIVGSDTLAITGNLGVKNWINDGYTIVDDATGQIYRVLERYKSPDNTIRLDKPWLQNGNTRVWVVPPPVGGGRYPCIAVYQKVMRF